MNERIQELIEQARKEELGNEFPQDVYEQEAVQQRLVQLVVRECARVAIEKQTENDLLNIVSENPAKDFAYALIKHFGVEEK